MLKEKNTLFKKIFFLSIFPIFFTLPTYAEVLKKIVITGNTKTKDSALIRQGNIEIGMDIDFDKLNEIQTNLRKKNQYILKKIDFKEGTLFIDIQDKWSLIPIPMISQSGYYYSRGILIYENNFLGNLSTFVPAISWTNSGVQGLLAYKNESLFTRNSGLKIILLNKSDLTKFQRRDEDVAIFESRLKTILISPNFNYKKHIFKLGPILFDKKVLNNNQEEIFYYRGGGAHFRYHYKNFKYRDIQFEGYTFTYNMFLLPNFQSKVVYVHDFKIDSSYPVFDDFINFISFLRYANDSSHLYPDLLGGKEAFRGYDSSSLPSDRYFAAALQYQKHVWKTAFASFFYEFNSTNIIKDVYNDINLNEHTVGFGIRYYFKKITIPALMVEYARNLTDKSNHLHINIGVGL